MTDIVWDEKRIEQVKALISKLSLAEAANIIGCSRSALSGAVWRHIQGNKPKRPHRTKIRRLYRGDRGKWDERRLTETWEERKARHARGKH